MFVNVQEGLPEAAFRIVNDPIREQQYIQKLVELGYMVRTRADANTWEARKTDYRRWAAALASNAQVISTDYYQPSMTFKSDYKVGFEQDSIYLVIKKNAAGKR
jgi:hypothetical protein